MECDSVLGQQSISGKNVSLILCAWKPCYVKSGHIYRMLTIPYYHYGKLTDCSTEHNNNINEHSNLIYYIN